MSNHVLFNGDCLEVLKDLPDDSVDSLITDPPAGISFMGKSWDSDKGGRDGWVKWMTDVMRECHRVLKPGAHGLVWALPRTSHWTATALEDAGFEIRDVVTHLFGSGFPKSLDISKAIDKTEPAADKAKQWQGWGTALKPASEHWILVRKPCSEKTVAANILKHGCGGINIDASRISPTPDYGRSAANSKGTVNAHNGIEGKAFKIAERDAEYASTLGRFPANLVLDQEAASMLDEQSGVLSSGTRTAGVRKGMGYHGGIDGDGGPAIQGNSGGASRFFYCAKAPKKDKGENNTHPTVKNTALMSYLIKMITPTNGVVLDPFNGSGSTGVAALALGMRYFGIEQDEAYFAIASERLALAEQKLATDQKVG